MFFTLQLASGGMATYESVWSDVFVFNTSANTMAPSGPILLLPTLKRATKRVASDDLDGS